MGLPLGLTTIAILQALTCCAWRADKKPEAAALLETKPTPPKDDDELLLVKGPAKDEELNDAKMQQSLDNTNPFNMLKKEDNTVLPTFGTQDELANANLPSKLQMKKNGGQVKTSLEKVMADMKASDTSETSEDANQLPAFGNAQDLQALQKEINYEDKIHGAMPKLQAQQVAEKEAWKKFTITYECTWEEEPNHNKEERSTQVINHPCATGGEIVIEGTTSWWKPTGTAILSDVYSRCKSELKEQLKRRRAKFNDDDVPMCFNVDVQGLLNREYKNKQAPLSGDEREAPTKMLSSDEREAIVYINEFFGCMGEAMCNQKRVDDGGPVKVPCHNDGAFLSVWPDDTQRTLAPSME
mmetsp:Transcript_53269/g.151780  ORF Transcript_53269/g.151780 Transcript_53269/m.151780 type:complete len:355 (-) Transcript_53269:60-1124(-)